MKHWEIKDVLYSGRNGTGARGEPIFSLKYNEIIGWDVYFDIEDIEILKPAVFYFSYHPYYNYWRTSGVVCFSVIGDRAVIETVNSIYILKEVDLEEPYVTRN